MRKTTFLILVVALLLGCNEQKGKSEGQTNPQPSLISKELTTLSGPGGTVALGDGLDQAKRAFPAPTGAKVMERSLGFVIVSPEGWGWIASGSDEFEAAVKDGKIIALSRSQPVGAGTADEAIKAVGEPSRRAAAKSAEMLVWDAGEYARVWLQMRSKTPIMPTGTSTIIGRVEDLKLLNIRADDPQSFVDQMDAAVQQMSSPEMRKVFEDAKKRALQKQKKG